MNGPSGTLLVLGALALVVGTSGAVALAPSPDDPSAAAGPPSAPQGLARRGEAQATDARPMTAPVVANGDDVAFAPPEMNEDSPDTVHWSAEPVPIVVRADDDATPVEGAAVRVLVSWRPEEFRSGVTDAAGRVALPTCRSSWRECSVVHVRARGFVVHAAEHDGDDVPVVVRLRRGRPLAGLVVHVGDGVPVVGAEVYVWDERTRKEIECDPRSYGVLRDGGLTTDRDGRFEIAGLPRGAHVTIAARAAGIGIATRRLAPDDDLTEIVLALGEGGVLDGLVTLDGPTPAGGVRVHAVAAGDEWRVRHPDARWLGALSPFAVTDGAGRYRIAGLKMPARYVAVAEGEEFAQGASAPATLRDGDTRATCDVALVTPAWLSVRCFAPDGSPAKADRCDLAKADGSPIEDPFFSGSSSSSSDSNEYSLHTRPPGSWLLLVRAKGAWQTARVPVELQPGEHRTVDVTLAPGLTLDGVVVDEDGRPVEGVDVTTGSGTEYRTVESDGNGAFSLAGLSAGTSTLDVVPDGLRRRMSVDVTCPRSDPLRIVLARRPGVVGRFFIPPGLGDEVIGSIRTETWERRIWPHTESDGRFQVPHVPDDEAFDLFLRCNKGGAPRVWRGLRARTHASLDLGTVGFALGRTVDGVVVDEKDAPLSAVVEPDESVRAQDARTDADGRFQLTGAPDGPFTALVRAIGRPSRRLVVGDGARVTIRCPAGVVVRGELTGASVERVAHRRLRFVRRPDARDDVPCFDDTDSDSLGAFELRLSPGSYDVWTVERGSPSRGDRARETLDRLEDPVGRADVGGSGSTTVVLRLPTR